MNYYDILQVSVHAEAEVIEATYRRLSAKYHPDVNNSPDATKKMQELNEAYSILRNSQKRKEYDNQLKNNQAIDDNSKSSTEPGWLDMLMTFAEGMNESLGEVCPNCGTKSRITQSHLSQNILEIFTHQQKVKCLKCGCIFVIQQ
jgi:curved DNA-binding protein CbpA